MLAAVQAVTAAVDTDPVAYGICQQLLSLRPAAIRGNASECLSPPATGGRGVDSVHQADAALNAARSSWRNAASSLR